jgi:hypothetical protein
MISSFEVMHENEEVAKVLAVTDAVDHGVDEWVTWTPMNVVDSFMSFTAEGSQRLAEMFAAQDPMIRTMMQAGVYPEGEMSLKNTAFTMRESFLDTLEAMNCYFDMHEKSKELYKTI